MQVLNKHKSSKTSSSDTNCQRCGRKHHNVDKPCPAINWECFVCRKKGHTSAVCRNKVVKAIHNVRENSSTNCRVVIDDKPIIMEVDTGACETIMSEKEYRQKFSKNKLITIIII